MKKVYKLDATHCCDKLNAVKAILKFNDDRNLDHAKNVFKSGQIEADPKDPAYRTLIEDLERAGVVVYDPENMPEPISLSHEQPCYT